MRNDTIIQAAGLTIRLSGETRTYATVVIDGRTYTGEIGNPAGKDSPDAWMDYSIMRGLYTLPEHAFLRVIEAIENEMR